MGPIFKGIAVFLGLLETFFFKFLRTVRNKLPFYAAIYAFMQCVWSTVPSSYLLCLLLKYRPYADTVSNHRIVPTFYTPSVLN
jgi:hypothetical protein